LLALTLPASWQLTRMFGIIGPAYAKLLSFTVFNIIRYWFLLKRFKMQPFTAKSVYTLLLAAASYFVCYLLMNDRTGFGWIVLRSSLFIVLYATGMFALRLTPDALPVLITLRKKLGFNR
jgi:O-antigen/teichoic acid export membrane protein